MSFKMINNSSDNKADLPTSECMCLQVNNEILLKKIRSEQLLIKFEFF